MVGIKPSYMFCWFKYEGFSYIGEIVRWDETSCDVKCDTVYGGKIIIENIPREEISAIRDSKLPWEVEENCYG